MSSELVPILLLLALVLIGELLFRRSPGAGGLLYNMSGTVGGVLWVLAGAFLLWGGSYLIGAILIVVGVNIHRSNFRIAKRELSGRSRLNG